MKTTTWYQLVDLEQKQSIALLYDFSFYSQFWVYLSLTRTIQKHQTIFGTYQEIDTPKGSTKYFGIETLLVFTYFRRITGCLMWGGCYIDIHMWFTSRWSRTTSTKAKCQEATLFLLQSIGRHGQGGRWCIGRRRSRFMQKISNAAGRPRFTNRILGTILTRRWRMQWNCRLRRIVCATATNKRFWGRGMHWWVDGRLILLEGKIEIEEERKYNIK